MSHPEYPQRQYPQQGAVFSGGQAAPAPARPQEVFAPAHPGAPAQPAHQPQHQAQPAQEQLSRPGQPLVSGAGAGRAEAAAIESQQTMKVVGSSATALAAPPTPPREGTVYGSRDIVVEDGRLVPTGRQPSLRIGWHTASLPALTEMGVSSPGTGLILGADHDKKPVPIRCFRGEPTRITLVGGVWAAQMVAFRALALGAQLVVMTADPQSWNGVGERAVGRKDGVIVLHGERPGSAIGTARYPSLVVHDLGMTGPENPPPIGPWQTQMTVIRRLDKRGVPALQRCDLLVLQRLHPTEAAVAETALRLTRHSAQLLQVMEDEMLALIGGGANRYLWLHPTAVERQFMGNAWR